MKVEKKPAEYVGTCRDRINAFKLNGIEDPIEYEDNNVKKLD